MLVRQQATRARAPPATDVAHVRRPCAGSKSCNARILCSARANCPCLPHVGLCSRRVATEGRICVVSSVMIIFGTERTLRPAEPTGECV